MKKHYAVITQNFPAHIAISGNKKQGPVIPLSAVWQVPVWLLSIPVQSDHICRVSVCIRR